MLPSAIAMSSGECQAVLVHGAGGGAWEWCLWERELAAAGVVPLAVELRPRAQGYEVRCGGRMVHVECVRLICCCDSHDTCVCLCVCARVCAHDCLCVRMYPRMHGAHAGVQAREARVHARTHSTRGGRWPRTLSPRPSARLRVSNLILFFCLTMCRAGHHIPGLRGPSDRILCCCVPVADPCAGYASRCDAMGQRAGCRAKLKK